MLLTSNPHGICVDLCDPWENILVANGQDAIRKVPTAYGDGLWESKNTDITDAHGSIITDHFSFIFALRRGNNEFLE